MRAGSKIALLLLVGGFFLQRREAKIENGNEKQPKSVNVSDLARKGFPSSESRKRYLRGDFKRPLLITERKLRRVGQIKDFGQAVPMPEINIVPIPEAPSIKKDVLMYGNISIPKKLTGDWRKDVFDIYSTFCGQAAFCNASNFNSNVVPKSGVFTCFNCSCDDDCGYYGDCCVDKYFVTPQNDDMTSCVSENNRACGNKIKYPYYFIFNKCPKNFTNSTLAEMCENPPSSSLTNSLPVTSPALSRTYANENCAKCHGLRQENYVRSAAHFRCTHSVLSTTIQREFCCYDIIDPPVSKRTQRPCDPSQNSPKRCNAPRMTESVKFLSDMCSRFKAMVYSGKVLYANIYCAMCPRYVFPGDRGYGGNPSKVHGIVSLDAVLVSRDPTPVFRKPQRAFIPSCKNTDIYDVFMGHCRRVECDWKRKYINGSCTREIIGRQTLTYGLRYLLTPANVPARIRSPNDLARMHVAKTASLLNSTDFTISPWQLKVTGHIEQSRNIYVSNFTVSQRVRVIQTQETFEKNEHLLYSTFDDYLFVDNVTQERVRFIASKTEKDEPVGYFKSMIVLTRGSPRPYVSYGYDAVKIRQNDSTLNNILDFDVFYKSDKYERTHTMVKLPIEELDTLNAELSNGSIIILNETRGNNTRFWFQVVENKGNVSVNSLNDFAKGVVTMICCCLSLVALFLTFVTYCLFADLRSPPGYNTMALVVHLFLAQLIFLVGVPRWEGESDEVCVFFGVLSHYLWISTFLWMGICAFHMHSVFTNIRPPHWTLKRFICYICVANGIPVALVTICILLHVTQHPYDYIGYGGRLCYISESRIIMIIFIVLPVALMLLANIIFFSRTVYFIRKIAENSAATLNKDDKNHTGVYFKLSVLLGLTWVLGFFMYATSSPVVAYLFIVANGCQGLLIFIAYCCNRRIYKKYHHLLRPQKKKAYKLSSDDAKASTRDTASTDV